MMKSNITLIGMPGSGKSTIGIILAKHLSFGFIDTDVLIQINQQKSLQQIIDESDHLNLRKIEERELLKINIERHVIATGGSAAYSEKAMTHLLRISTVIFLMVDFDIIQKRIHNFGTRGIAKAADQSFRELYDERQVLYQRYAEITMDCNLLDQEQLAQKIATELEHLQR
jgi:shikimate kinase